MRYQQEEAEEKSYLRVTHRHPKTGLVAKKDPYIMRVVAEGANKSQYIEYPAGSGNLWSSDNGKLKEPIGRWDKSKPEGDRFLKGVPHIEWTPPLTEDQKLAKSIVAKDEKINQLEAELAAIKAEREKRNAPKVNKE